MNEGSRGHRGILERARAQLHLMVWRRGAYASDARPVIVGGCGRSGTTLMRVILDTHPGLCCGPETGLLLARPMYRSRLDDLARRLDMPRDRIVRLLRSTRTQAHFVDALFAEFARAQGKPRWVEKTPRNVEVLDFIFRHFPKATFVHMIRDGRDTVCSLRTHPRHKVVNGELVPLNTRNPLDQCIETWVSRVRAGLRYRAHPGYAEIRYEDLVTRPEPCLRALFDRLGEPWEPRVLAFNEVKSATRDVTKFPQNPEATQPLSTKALGRWRQDLSADEIAMFKRMAGDLLIELGYVRDEHWDAQAV